MRDIHSPSAGSQVTTVQRIDQGGHGGTTAEQARTNLQIYGLDEINKPNGPVGLDEGGKIRSDSLNSSLISLTGIYGPKRVSPGDTVMYFLSHGDSFTDVIHSSSKGITKILENGIEYTAPNYETEDEIHVNDRVFHIVVSDKSMVYEMESYIVEEDENDSFRLTLILSRNPIPHSAGFKVKVTFSTDGATTLSRTQDVTGDSIVLTDIDRVNIATHGSEILLEFYVDSEKIGPSTRVTVLRPNQSARRGWIQRIGTIHGNTIGTKTTPSCFDLSRDGNRFAFTSGNGFGYQYYSSAICVFDKDSEGVFRKSIAYTSNPIAVENPASRLYFLENGSKGYLVDSEKTSVNSAANRTQSIVNVSSTAITLIKHLAVIQMNEAIAGVSGIHRYNIGSLSKVLNNGKIFLRGSIAHHAGSGATAVGDESQVFIHGQDDATPGGRFCFSQRVSIGGLVNTRSGGGCSPFNDGGGTMLADGCGDHNVAESKDFGTVVIWNPIGEIKNSPASFTNSNFRGFMNILRKDANDAYSLLRTVMYTRDNSKQILAGDGVALINKTIVHPTYKSDAGVNSLLLYTNDDILETGLRLYHSPSGEYNDIVLRDYSFSELFPDLPVNVKVKIKQVNHESDEFFIGIAEHKGSKFYIAAVKIGLDGEIIDSGIIFQTDYNSATPGNPGLSLTDSYLKSFEFKIDVVNKLVFLGLYNKDYIDIFKY